eukprot:GHVQ01037446.1.p1 GENE.GHVQ01037446.1~~GHVQ01037446.1.p1  ORF type:complete len:134 (-),score=14.25 GHVQ01037446.1:487-888(-)
MIASHRLLVYTDKSLTMMQSAKKASMVVQEVTYSHLPEVPEAKVSKIIKPDFMLEDEELSRFELMIKLDKSQTERAFWIEKKVYQMMGIQQEMLDRWMEAHRVSVVRKHAAGIDARTHYQRKTGDAATFTGNT